MNELYELIEKKIKDIRISETNLGGEMYMMISVIRSMEKKTGRIYYCQNLKKMWYLSIILRFGMRILIWEF